MALTSGNQKTWVSKVHKKANCLQQTLRPWRIDSLWTENLPCFCTASYSRFAYENPDKTAAQHQLYIH